MIPVQQVAVSQSVGDSFCLSMVAALKASVARLKKSRLSEGSLKVVELKVQGRAILMIKQHLNLQQDF